MMTGGTCSTEVGGSTTNKAFATISSDRHGKKLVRPSVSRAQATERGVIRSYLHGRGTR
jgi:hypothetical protein